MNSENIVNLYTKLSTDNVAFFTAFGCGMLVHMKFRDEVLQYPLSSILRVIIPSAIYGGCGHFVSSLLPVQYKLIVPILLISSAIYYKYYDFTKKTPKLIK